jgi:hypothetical protein
MRAANTQAAISINNDLSAELDWIFTEMGRSVVAVVYVLSMVAVIVGVDVAFIRNQFWLRLMSNVGIVLLFAAFYLRFLGRPWSPWK